MCGAFVFEIWPIFLIREFLDTSRDLFRVFVGISICMNGIGERRVWTLIAMKSIVVLFCCVLSF